jgi:CDP-6-deoxy-D-xylo-4-hexulose-3-dehydrase
MDRREIVRKYINELSKYYPKNPPRKLLPLAHPVLNTDEEISAIDAILDDWFPTMGNHVKNFENMFSSYMGSKFGVMVNSGSSANLISIGAIKEIFKIKNDSEVIVPAISWSTTVFPISQYNLIPHFVDVNLSDFNMRVESIENAIGKNTKIIMVVHALGFPANMKKIMQIAKEHDLLVIEDSCESYGAKLGNKNVGTFGDVATCSFYASHQMTTIEGGMLLTNREDVYEISKSMRAHGWIRDFNQKLRDEYIKKYPKIDSRFMFLTEGYNFRPTEISAAIGIEQLKNFDKNIERRRNLANLWNNELEKFDDIFIVHRETEGTKAIYLGYPITLNRNFANRRDDLMRFLEVNGIETRPIVSGNFVDQPIMEKIRFKKEELPNSELISKNSFYIGCYSSVTKDQAQKVITKITDFFKS